MSGFIARPECRSGYWHVVTYEILADGKLVEVGDLTTLSPCLEGSQPPTVVAEPAQTDPAGPAPATNACYPVADPPIRRAAMKEDKHKPSGIFAKLLQGLDLLSDEPAHLAGYDWAYKVTWDGQSGANQLNLNVSGFGFVYHALGNSTDDFQITYKASIKCTDSANGCSIDFDDSSSDTKKVGECLAVQIIPTWTSAPSGDSLQVQVELTVTLDAGSTGFVSGPGGGSGGSATFPGAAPSITVKVGSFKWKCKKTAA